MQVKFNWTEFTEKDLENVNKEKGSIEDDIYGFLTCTANGTYYLIDIHYSYYNSKDYGFFLEVYEKTVHGGHGNWLGTVGTIKSAKSYLRFRSRAEKEVSAFLEKNGPYTVIEDKIYDIPNFTDKLGEIVVDSFMEDDNLSVDIGKGIMQVLNECQTRQELEIAEHMLTAIFGYSLDTLIDNIRERDQNGHIWESI